MGKITRTDTSVVQIKLAFLGAIRNLCLLGNALVQIDNIPMYQYTNYLSQVALCIELGLKSIISNTDNFECIHDIEKLFSATPPEFQQKFKSSYPDDAAFNSGMKNMGKMFVNFRYMEAESTLPEYFDEAMINSDKSISIKKAANLPAFQFSRILLEDIKEYEDSVREKKLKQMKNIDFSDPDYVIGQYLNSIGITGNFMTAQVAPAVCKETKMEEITITRLDEMFKFAGGHSEKGLYFRGEYNDNEETACLPQRLRNCCGYHSEERNREWFTGALESLGIGTPYHQGKGETTWDNVLEALLNTPECSWRSWDDEKPEALMTHYSPDFKAIRENIPFSASFLDITSDIMTALHFACSQFRFLSKEETEKLSRQEIRECGNGYLFV